MPTPHLDFTAFNKLEGAYAEARDRMIEAAESLERLDELETRLARLIEEKGDLRTKLAEVRKELVAATAKNENLKSNVESKDGAFRLVQSDRDQLLEDRDRLQNRLDVVQRNRTAEWDSLNADNKRLKSSRNQWRWLCGLWLAITLFLTVFILIRG